MPPSLLIPTVSRFFRLDLNKGITTRINHSEKLAFLSFFRLDLNKGITTEIAWWIIDRTSEFFRLDLNKGITTFRSSTSTFSILYDFSDWTWIKVLRLLLVAADLFSAWIFFRFDMNNGMTPLPGSMPYYTCFLQFFRLDLNKGITTPAFAWMLRPFPLIFPIGPE